MKLKPLLLGGIAIALVASNSISAASAEECRVAWSRYIGWEIAGYIQEFGIADEVGAKHGVELSYVFLTDYAATLEQTAAGSFQAVTATTIDALGFLSSGGVPSEVIVIGDYSNGNDAILAKDPSGSVRKPSDVVDYEVYLYQLTVSDYLFERWLALDGDGLTYRDFTVINSTDADIGNVYSSGPNGIVAVTWNPMVLELRASVPGTVVLFDSSRIPGEILDGVIARQDASENCKHAVVESWYLGLAAMNEGGEVEAEAIAYMAEMSSGGAKGEDAISLFTAQLSTTMMFYNPLDAIAVAEGGDLQEATGFVQDFALNRGMLNEPVGILFPDGTVVGDQDNVLLTFNPAYTKVVAEGL